MRPHLWYKNFHPKTLEAAERLFSARPWALGDAERQMHAESFVGTVCGVYGAPMPHLFIGENVDSPEADSLDGVILLPQWSILTLFYVVRRYVCETQEWESTTEFAWACSLFYRTRPSMFRARVREGRILGVSARATYTTESWAKLVEHGVTLGDDLLVSNREANAILNGRITDEVEHFANVESEPVSERSDDLDSLTRDQVRALCVSAGIPRQGRTKGELIEALREAGVRR